MHCRDAQFYLRLRRQAGDELGGDIAADLNRHLAGCPACGADAASAASFDRAVAGALRAVPVPPGLRDKLLAQASAQHGAVIRHKLYRVTALAASVFLAVGLAFGLFSGRPKLDAEALVIANDELSQQPDQVLARWLAGLKVPPELPKPFDPELLVFLGSEPIQGKDVPVAVFRHRTDPREVAKVYILRSNGPFDIRDLRPAGISNTVAEVIDESPRHPGVKYLIVYKHTPDGLKPFLNERLGGIAQRPRT
jgi:hypothetical protein